jgi:hypothetical protein
LNFINKVNKINFIGVMMISATNELIIQYPKEWVTKVPFESWFIPGIIAIVLFGLRNIIAAILCFIKKTNNSWLMSAIMSGIFFMSIVSQVIILGEWYLATVEFLILSLIQLGISGYAFAGYKKIQY